ncbi:TPA: ThiF family adenylyltransferase [Acinetobacter baumannii]
MLDSLRRQQLIHALHEQNFNRLSLDELMYKNTKYNSSILFTGDDIIFRGELNISTNNKNYIFDIVIAIYDLKLISLPIVYIVNPNENALKLPLPHIIPRPEFKIGNRILHSICYAFSDDITIPRYNCSEFIEFIINQTSITLKNIINPDTLIEQLNNEIEPTWVALSRVNKANIQTLSFGKLPTQYEKTINFTIINNDKNIIFNGGLIFIPDTQNVPKLSSFLNPDFSIKSLDKFFHWIKSWDKSGHNILMRTLKLYKEFEKPFFFGFIYREAILYFSIELDSQTISRMEKYNNLLKFKFNNNQNLGFGIGQHYSLEKLVNRNIQDLKNIKNLNNLKILQIGCGAIGGYLTDSLFKVGAGIGESSKLTLVDSDSLGRDNLGRHFLNASYLGVNKAEALKLYLEFNYRKYLVNDKLNISCETINVKSLSSNFYDEFDVVIDATGKFEVAEYLNELNKERSQAKQFPILHLWIFANGECVQAFWNSHKTLENKGGCHYCLSSLWQCKPKEFYPLPDKTRETTLRITRPCANYTPYTISSSLNVASMGIEILLAWAGNTLKSNYFTHYSSTLSENRNIHLKNEVFKQLNCPFCK